MKSESKRIQQGDSRGRDCKSNGSLKGRRDQEGGKARGEEERQHRLIVEYDRRSCSALPTILKNNYDAATARDARFPTMFPKVPKPVYKKGTNIKQLLCRSKLPPPRNINTRAAVTPSNSVQIESLG